jgi:hypothetical protein
MPDDDANPYRPPQSKSDCESRGWFRWEQDATFTVGTREVHEITMSASLWSGRETYSVDGQVVLSTKKPWGRRRFRVGKEETHEVEVVVTPTAAVRVFVDGELRHDNPLRELTKSSRAAFAVGIVLGVVIGFMACVVSLLLTLLSR